MKTLSRQLFLLIIFCGSFVNAETIVRMQLQLGSDIENIDVKLFNSAAPDTVESFLSFVDVLPNITVPPEETLSYTDTFIHRYRAGEILEGGFFTYTPSSGLFQCTGCDDSNADESTFLFPGGLQRVTIPALTPSIASEVVKLNTRGTLGMRKSGTASSSPNHWYINLQDNPALDEFSGIFGQTTPLTVFAELINNSLSVVDNIGTNPDVTFTPNLATPSFLTDIHFRFGSLPLVDYIEGNAVIQANLVRINSIENLFTIESDLPATVTFDTDMGLVLSNTDSSATITITNTSLYDIRINEIATTDALESPFSIGSTLTGCLNPIGTIAPAESCTVSVTLNSATIATFDDTFNIELGFGDGVLPEKQGLSYTYSITGRTVTELAPEIEVSLETFDFSGVKVGGQSAIITIGIENTGTVDLDISSINNSGDTTNFLFANNCTLPDPPVAAGESCVIRVQFAPVSKGQKNLIITINSNDSDEPVIQIPLSGFGDNDSDTVIAPIEMDAPNNGDNNNDGIADELQDNVVSIAGENGEYISVIIEDKYSFSNVSPSSESDPNNQISELPENFDFRPVVLSYEIITEEIGEIIDIGLVLSSGDSPVAYFLFGPTTDNLIPHWEAYEFIEIFLNSTLTSPEGKTIKRNLIIVQVQDGGFGDMDFSANGRIFIGPAIPAFEIPMANTGSNGAINLRFLMVFILLFLLKKVFYVVRKKV